MPRMSSNMISSIYSGSSFSYLFRIAICSQRVIDLIPRPSDLFAGMIEEGGNITTLTKKY